MKIRPMRALVAAALVMVMACGGDSSGPTPPPAPPPPPPPPPAPVPGNLTVSYTGPTATDGAIMLRVSGATINSVAPVGSLVAASSGGGTTSVRVIITGTLANGDLFTVAVPDVAAVASYTVAIEAVADKATFALGDQTKYAGAIRK